MGVIIKERDLSALERSGMARPVFYCHFDKALEEQAIPINVEMAKKLSAIKPNRIDGSSYYAFSSLTEFPFLFPFKYRVTKEQLMQDERFTLSTFDATLSVAMK